MLGFMYFFTGGIHQCYLWKSFPEVSRVFEALQGHSLWSYVRPHVQWKDEGGPHSQAEIYTDKSGVFNNQHIILSGFKRFKCISQSFMSSLSGPTEVTETLPPEKRQSLTVLTVNQGRLLK